MKLTLQKLLCMAVLLVSSVSYGQMFLFDVYEYDQSNPLNCDSVSPGEAPNFYCSNGNYLANADETITFCPDLTQASKVSIIFATNIGFQWDVHPSDTLYIYDGPTTSAPLIGAYNTATHPNGFSVLASFLGNPSGCLTLRFVSDGANQGTGWRAKVGCGDAPQPFYPHLEAFYNGTGPNVINPTDTGYVNMCYGDSVLLVAKPDFPYSLENTGTGYSQNANNATYVWTIGGVGVFTNEDDSLWFTPPTRQGFFVDVRISDPFPQPARISCKIRVSQLPNFFGTGPVEDTVCLGQNTELVGGVTPTDTVGVNIPEGSFDISGTFAGLTPLPDGTGAVYETTVGMSGFGNAVYTGPTDIEQICLDIEHSYIGDIEIGLTCPNGTTVSLINANQIDTINGVPALFQGGCGNGYDICLGNDTDVAGGPPGAPVWTYCFSTQNATFGTMCDEMDDGTLIINNANGLDAMNPNGVYLPDGDFNDFIGCPLNGPWTIVVKDNQGQDDGYIFQWGITFNANLYPAPESYQNTVVSDFWTNDPTILTGQNDTSIIVIPTTPGYHSYTYNVTDNFGCDYDTTVQLFTLPQPTIFPDTTACFYSFNVGGTTAFAGGVWSAADTCVHISDVNAMNPVIYTTVAGTYTVTFTDNACGSSVSSDIFFPPFVYTQVLDTVICQNTEYIIYALPDPGATNYSWSTGQSGSSIVITQPGEYIVTASNVCHSHTDTATIGGKICDILAPNVIVLSSTNGNNLFFVDYEGVAKYNCVIVNRWGNTIYEYDDPAGTWNGMDSNGKLVEEGTYFYRIIATLEGGEELTKQGFVQVYR